MVGPVGFLDRLKRASNDEGSIHRMLQESGATTEQAKEIVQVLRQRLSPDEMHVCLSDPENPMAFRTRTQKTDSAWS